MARLSRSLADLKGRRFDAPAPPAGRHARQHRHPGIRPRSNSGLIGSAPATVSGCSPTIGSPPRLPHVLDGFLAFAKELGIKDLTPDWQLPSAPSTRPGRREKLAASRPCSSAPLPARHSRIGLPPATPRWRITPQTRAFRSICAADRQAGQDLAAGSSASARASRKIWWGKPASSNCWR